MPRVIGVCLAALCAVLVAVAAARAADGIFDPFDPAPAQRLRAAAAADRARRRRRLPRPRSTAAGVPAARRRSRPGRRASSAARPRTPPPRRWSSSSSTRSTRAGWDFQPLDGYGVSLALPFRLLGPPEAEEGGERRWSRDGSLTVLTHRFDADGRPRLARRRRPGRCRNRPRRPPARSRAHDHRRRPARRPALLHPLGRDAGGWSTVYLASGADDAAAMNLAAASIRPGLPLPWDLPADGRLTRLVEAASELVGCPRPTPGWCRRSIPARCLLPRPGPAAPAPASSSAAHPRHRRARRRALRPGHARRRQPARPRRRRSRARRRRPSRRRGRRPHG